MRAPIRLTLCVYVQYNNHSYSVFEVERRWLLDDDTLQLLKTRATKDHIVKVSRTGGFDDSQSFSANIGVPSSRSVAGTRDSEDEQPSLHRGGGGGGPAASAALQVRVRINDNATMASRASVGPEGGDGSDGGLCRIHRAAGQPQLLDGWRRRLLCAGAAGSGHWRRP